MTPRSRCWPARGAARCRATRRCGPRSSWSYGLCTEAERAVWERLSVFAGSFDLAAARDVAACPLVPADQVGDVLAALVDKSVVLRGDGEDPSGPGYRLIAPARDYGADRLAAADQEADGRRRHARRYLRRALGFRRHLLADDQTERLRATPRRARRPQRRARARLRRRRARPAAGRGPARRPRYCPTGSCRGGCARASAGRTRSSAGSPSRRAAAAERAGQPRGAWRHARVARGGGARQGGHRRRRAGRPTTGPRPRLPRAAARARLCAAPIRSRSRRPSRRGGASPRWARTSPCAASTSSSRRPTSIGGNLTAAAAAGQRALAGLGPGERWLHGHVALISRRSRFTGSPGGRPECARRGGRGAARHARPRRPGRRGLRARRARLAGGRRRARPARRLAARGGADALGAGGRQARRQRRRWRGTAQRSADAAARVLGADWYAELHARGAGTAARADRRARGGGR